MNNINIIEETKLFNKFSEFRDELLAYVQQLERSVIDKDKIIKEKDNEIKEVKNNM